MTSRPPARLPLPERIAGAPLHRRLAWIIGLRLLLQTVLFALTVLLYLRGPFVFGSYSINVILGTLTVAYALGGVYATLLRRNRYLIQLAFAQLVLDQATWSTLILVSGGVTSGATALYGLTCLTGAMLIGPRGAGVAAISGGVFYSILCAGLVTGWISVPLDQAKGSYAVAPGQAVYPFLLNLLVLLVVSLLAGYLAERLRLQAGRLQEETLRADQAERLAVLGRLSAGLAHEIRNPLGSILGSIQLLRSDGGLGEEAQQLCRIVERETARLDDLVEDMMRLAGPRRPVLSKVNVARIARDVVALASQSGRGADVFVSLRASPPEGTLVALADSAQVRQLIWNLVRNAVQASNPGADVSVRVGQDGPSLFLEVHDDGVGIAPEATQRLFDAFYTTRSSGMGIGLAVVKRIVEDHAWAIQVTSSAGMGATFRVTMPAIAGYRPSLPGVRSSNRAPPGLPQGSDRS